MKNKIIKLFVCALAALTLTLCLTGCPRTQAAEKTAVCFILGPTANAQGLNLNSQLVSDSLYGVIRNQGHVSVILADGAPKCVFSETYALTAQQKNATGTRLDMKARTDAASLLQTMLGLRAEVPEVDYFAALQLASRMLRSLSGYAAYRVVMVGTGLNTTGLLNFRNNLLCAEAADVVAALGEREAIPSLQGISVYAQQLGDVAPPQTELSPAQKLRLEQIYSGLVEAGGGSFQPDKTPAAPAAGQAELPEVTPVALTPEEPVSFDAAALETETALDTPRTFTERELRFKGDSAEYDDPAAAAAVLQPVADYLLRYPEVNALLAGATAGDKDTAETRALSLQRALAAKATLVSLGVPAARLLAVGLGSESSPFHVWGMGTGAAGAVNRTVTVCSAAGGTGLLLLAAAGTNREPAL